MITIETVHSEDTKTVIDLLKNAALPIEDLPEGLPNFVIAKEGEIAVGVAGLESLGMYGLLRSVAVDPAYQGKGIAGKLVNELIAQAENKRLAEIYLITTTADHYFNRFKFKSVDREFVPDEIRKTQQFNGLCPSSAVVMKHVLKGKTSEKGLSFSLPLFESLDLLEVRFDCLFVNKYILLH